MRDKSGRCFAAQENAIDVLGISNRILPHLVIPVEKPLAFRCRNHAIGGHLHLQFQFSHLFIPFCHFTTLAQLSRGCGTSQPRRVLWDGPRCIPHLTWAAMSSIASRLVETSALVVAQEDTLMRMARRPFHRVPPHQHLPSA